MTKREILKDLKSARYAKAGNLSTKYISREDFIYMGEKCEEYLLQKLAVIEALELINPKPSLLQRIFMAIKPSWL